MIKIEKTTIDGLLVIQPKVFSDDRGIFFETYNKNEFFINDLKYNFIQDNQSTSKKGVLRGIHYQINHPQTKLIRVIKGEIYDVAVDLRKESKTFGNYFGIILSENNFKQLLIPKGFGHGFYVISDEAIVSYKVDTQYFPNDEGGILWSDKKFNIKWPLIEKNEPFLSDKDKKFSSFLKSGL